MTLTRSRAMGGACKESYVNRCLSKRVCGRGEANPQRHAGAQTDLGQRCKPGVTLVHVCGRFRFSLRPLRVRVRLFKERGWLPAFLLLQCLPRDQVRCRATPVQAGVWQRPAGVQASLRWDGRHQRPDEQAEPAAGRAGRLVPQIPGQVPETLMWAEELLPHVVFGETMVGDTKVTRWKRERPLCFVFCCFQVVAEDYNKLKDLKQVRTSELIRAASVLWAWSLCWNVTWMSLSLSLCLSLCLSLSLFLLQTSEYQSKKKECRRLRHKLFHIKRMVKDYDKNHSWRRGDLRWAEHRHTPEHRDPVRPKLAGPTHPVNTAHTCQR